MNTARLELTRILAADPDTVFRAFTRPEVMKRWFFAGPGWSVDVQNDSRVDGDYSLVMKSPDGGEYATNGVYRVVDPPTRLVFTWNSSVATDSIVTIEFEPVEKGTRLTLTHDFLRTREATDKHRAGWTGCLDNLVQFIQLNSA